MRIVDIIAKKRSGLAFVPEEIEALVLGYARGEVPDYQAAAWLMAVFLRGMNSAETFALTQAIVRSGRSLSWPASMGAVVDKHSTGGVGDKTSLVVVPLVAAAGAPVAKMSGRGLGFTGGTLDKLESIPGFSVRQSVERFQSQVEHVGAAIVAQSAELAPADGKLYALRDVTATVESLPLIASSVMGKKIAAGAEGIVLDVKYGRGAFCATIVEAEALARTMLDLGAAAGRRVRAVLSPMVEPLGMAVGNALEVAEAVRALRGEGPADLNELVLLLGTQMLLVAGVATDEASARATLERAIASGAALSKFREIVSAQGGDPRAIDDLSLLPQAGCVRAVVAPRAGFVVDVDARAIAETVMRLGGGRARKADSIDLGVGVLLRAKTGTAVESGAPLCEVHGANKEAANRAVASLAKAFGIGDAAPPPGWAQHRVLI
ncbi:MAG: thymidine phosphorylase [Chloroflexota bacterium]